ncbi:unnamed protein product [Notodromas monacha]|uniref:FerIin domain-containing protein n=1 Tax=Notodromas monacha TaxID=399045 RepID=A0A7R9BFL4_9CRUS|nr:unnamed protein product [Notodromas monacha]CAG0913748.1 unnamed protein product [Notodromas monacha]
MAGVQMDLGTIYDQPQHTYLHRWLLLSNPTDERNTSGYLKICVAVLGPGDEAPSFDSSISSTDEDLETNVLYPSGIALAPASFAISIYRAEDLPRRYLPVFGPAFVNFYGTTRKFSALQSAYDEKQNEGIVEGCSYRGRALVSLTTQIGEYPKVSISAIDSDEILKVDKFLRRRRFVIHVSFMNASMISEYENPVEFEVSMGNFGNKFEDSVMPSPSTTQPTNPVFDGSGYYFLPWNESKPEVAVTCQWEDIGFRIKSLNKLLNMSRRLKNGIRQLEDALKAGKTTQDLAVQFLAVIDRLLADCEQVQKFYFIR